MQTVKRSKQFQFKKQKQHSKLTKKHIVDQLVWGKKYMSLTTEWISVIFSVEKRFNLDGADGIQYYWHCLKQKEQYYSTIKLSQNHKDYTQQLEKEFLLYKSNWGGENWLYL